ncbi:MAG: PAS domain S-box protein [Terracidiphilus sp.]|nr:PAS domain S-box protein [Terracidiphilus sp.]
MKSDTQAGLNVHREQPRIPIEDLPVAYVEFDARGTIIYANSIARSLHCQKGDDLVGKSAWDIMAADQIELSRKAFMAIIESGEEPPVIQRVLYTQNGEYRTYEMFRSLIRNDNGQTTGLRYVYIDITKAQRAREEAQQTHQFMKNILESLSEVVIVIDSLGIVRLANQAAEDFTGQSAAEMFGRQIEECLIFVSYQMESKDAFDLCAALDRSYAGKVIILDRKKQEVPMEINTSPIVDKKHEYTMGVVVTLRKPKSEPSQIVS